MTLPVSGNISTVLGGLTSARLELTLQYTDLNQHERDRMVVPESLLGAGEHFVLEVQGDSMINAGIYDGDHVIIRRGATAHSGEVDVDLPDMQNVSSREHSLRADVNGAKGTAELESGSGDISFKH